VLEQTDFVASVFEFVDVGPNLGYPPGFMHGGFSAARAASMKGDAVLRRSLRGSRFELHLEREFEEYAAYFFQFIVRTKNVLVAEQVSKSEFAGFDLGFFAGVEGPVFGPQLLHRIAGHPENIFVSHTHPSQVRKRS